MDNRFGRVSGISTLKGSLSPIFWGKCNYGFFLKNSLGPKITIESVWHMAGENVWLGKICGQF